MHGACSKRLHKQVVVLRRLYVRQAKEDSRGDAAKKEFKTKSSQLPFDHYKKALQQEEV